MTGSDVDAMPPLVLFLLGLPMDYGANQPKRQTSTLPTLTETGRTRSHAQPVQSTTHLVGRQDVGAAHGGTVQGLGRESKVFR